MPTGCAARALRCASRRRTSAGRPRTAGAAPGSQPGSVLDERACQREQRGRRRKSDRTHDQARRMLRRRHRGEVVRRVHGGQGKRNVCGEAKEDGRAQGQKRELKLAAGARVPLREVLRVDITTRESPLDVPAGAQCRSTMRGAARGASAGLSELHHRCCGHASCPL